jgi:hypothetical protein
MVTSESKIPNGTTYNLMYQSINDTRVSFAYDQFETHVGYWSVGLCIRDFNILI